MARISLEHLSVNFPVYDLKGRSLRKDLLRIGTGGRIVAGNDGMKVYVSALDDVTLTINHGERVGLLGHNGAGKTTLLKVLSGVYEPVTGQIDTEGRVAPLFDLTGGMDMEATGYENIRIRSLLLGMSTAEIAARSDEIGEATELGDFLSMPIRTYSSGMFLRLGFAIATSIVPDVLLMDE